MPLDHTRNYFCILPGLGRHQHATGPRPSQRFEAKQFASQYRCDPLNYSRSFLPLFFKANTILLYLEDLQSKFCRSYLFFLV